MTDDNCTMFWTALNKGTARRLQSGVASSSCATALLAVSPAVPAHVGCRVLQKRGYIGLQK